MQPPRHPDAVAPERSHDVHSDGVRLRVHEWGDPEGRPLLLAHGMADHGRGFDRLAPLLAERFRVVAFDARGHGDSEHVDAYGWACDLRDLRNLLDWLGARGRAVRVVGHSKGGAQSMDVAALWPERIAQLVDIDGFGPPADGWHTPGEAPEAERVPAEDCAAFLDARRRLRERDGWRPYRDFDALVLRRARQNPRLGRAWLRYFVYHGAREVPEGWVWKLDPLTSHGSGPWQPEWIARFWEDVRVPVLAVTGDVHDAWGPIDEPTLAERLAGVRSVERAVVAGAGHFVHMEAPRETARLLLDYLDR